MPYEVQPGGSWRFLSADQQRRLCKYHKRARMWRLQDEAAHHLRADGTPDKRFVENATVGFDTRAPNAGTWLISEEQSWEMLHVAVYF